MKKKEECEKSRVKEIKRVHAATEGSKEMKNGRDRKGRNVVGRRWFGSYYFVHPREGSIEDTVQVVLWFFFVIEKTEKDQSSR